MGIIIGTVTYPDLKKDEKFIRSAVESVKIDSQCQTSIVNLSGCSMGIVSYNHEKIQGDNRVATIGNSGLVWTGYITNIHGLRKRLEALGIVFDEVTGDSQILLESYLRLGMESLQGLNGLYSIVIWDDKQKRFSAITDRYGFTKIYYWLGPDGIMFASECKAIINHPEYQKAIDKEGINNFLGAGHCFGKNTLFKDIKLIPQGCVLVYENRKLSFKKYWDYFVNPTDETLEEFADRFFYYLKSSFESCVNGEKGIFIPLSGGLDSRIMAGVAASYGLETYTCTVGRKGSWDFRYSSKIAKKVHALHTKLTIESDYISKYGPLGIQLTDGLITCHPFYMLRIFDCKKLQHIPDTLISGFGGGELTGHLRHADIEIKPNVPLIQQYIEQRFLQVFKDNELREILKPTFHSLIGQNYTYLNQKIVNAHAEDLIDKIWIALLSERSRRYTADALLSVLGHGWNVVVPFFDNQFMDFISTVPKRLTNINQKLFCNVISKYLPDLARLPSVFSNRIHRKIKPSSLEEGLSWRLERLKGMVPVYIRQKYSHLKYKLANYPFVQKIGIGDNRNWVVDCDEAIRSGSAHYFHELFSDRERMGDLFNINAVNKLFNAHLERRVNEYRKLSAIATIIEWRRQFGL